MRMGMKRVVVANSYDAVRELWIKNKDSNNSRPVLFTFHSVVSKTQGFTVGTTPYGESFKRKKKLISVALSRKNVENWSWLIDQESKGFLRRIEMNRNVLLEHSRDKDIDAFKLLQGFVLRVSLFISYGYLVKVEHTDRCKLMEEISYVENQIVRLRGHSSNLQDYLPFLRLLPGNGTTKLANDLRKRRDVYMSKFMNGLSAKLENDEDVKDTIASKALRGSSEFPEVTPDELNSVFLTMVSAGLDNTPLVLNHILGHFSQPSSGQQLQEIAILEILKQYGDLKTAYTQCALEYKVDYIEALIKEGLRYFSVLPTSLPRQTSKDIIFKNTVIPKGTILFMNTFAANHDPHHFPCYPNSFQPSRFLDQDNKLLKKEECTTMLTFGAGARMCSGAHLAYKEMYVTLIRLIILYKVFPPSNRALLMELDPFKLNAVPDSVAIEPHLFKINLQIRDPQVFNDLQVWSSA